VLLVFMAEIEALEHESFEESESESEDEVRMGADFRFSFLVGFEHSDESESVDDSDSGTFDAYVS
jgi:hypothetical protein